MVRILADQTQLVKQMEKDSKFATVEVYMMVVEKWVYGEEGWSRDLEQCILEEE